MTNVEIYFPKDLRSPRGPAVYLGCVPMDFIPNKGEFIEVTDYIDIDSLNLRDDLKDRIEAGVLRIEATYVVYDKAKKKETVYLTVSLHASPSFL
jgi:hypothetical protein